VQKTHMANGKWRKSWRIGREAWVVSGIDLLSAIGPAVEAEARKSAKGKPLVRLRRQRLMKLTLYVIFTRSLTDVREHSMIDAEGGWFALS